MIANLLSEIEKYNQQCDSLIDDITELRKEHYKLYRKLDEVVSMVKDYVAAETACSGDGTHNLLEKYLNRILEDE